jgi:hypothetical protein
VNPPAPSLAGRSLYRPFFIAGVAIVLTVGGGWGAWLLWQIGLNGHFTAASLHEVNAHGHAQIFGWVGLFVMGFAYQMFPAIWQSRLVALPAVPFVFAAMLAGVAMRTIMMASPTAPGSVVAVIVGGGLETIAIATFVAQLGLTWRKSLAPRQPYLRFVAAALVFFVAQSVFGVWHTVNTMTAGDRRTLVWYVATYQAVLRDLQVHGFALCMVLGVSMFILPRFYRLPPVSDRRARLAWNLIVSGVLGECALFLAYRFTGRHVFAAALLVPWTLLGIAVMAVVSVFRPWRPFPRPDRTSKFVRAAYLWLMVSLALLLLLPVHQLATRLPFSHAYYGSIRHAITVGFISQMIMGVAARVVPDLRRLSADGLGSLAVPFVVLNLGCFLRVTLQALTDMHPFFFALVGVSGIFELSALAWWGAKLVRLMVRRPVTPDGGVLASG